MKTSSQLNDNGFIEIDPEHYHDEIRFHFCSKDKTYLVHHKADRNKTESIIIGSPESIFSRDSDKWTIIDPYKRSLHQHDTFHDCAEIAQRYILETGKTTGNKIRIIRHFQDNWKLETHTLIWHPSYHSDKPFLYIMPTDFARCYTNEVLTEYFSVGLFTPNKQPYFYDYYNDYKPHSWVLHQHNHEPRFYPDISSALNGFESYFNHIIDHTPTIRSAPHAIIPFKINKEEFLECTSAMED